MDQAVFFDRDGVINSLVDRGDGRHTSPWSLEEFALLPHVADAVALLAPYYKCFVVTNQPHVGHEMSEQELHRIHGYLRNEVAGLGEILYCSTPDTPCYKPNAGMVLDIIQRHQLSRLPRQHYMVGDRWKDVVCGHQAGLITIFVGNKYQCGEYPTISPDYIVTDIYAASKLIMERTVCGTKN